MNDIPQLQADLFRKAVRSFTDESVVYVSSPALEAFLDETNTIDLPAEERLRRLAVALEYETLEHGWDSLHLIYQTAAQINPHNPRVFHSWGISACTWLEGWICPTSAKRVAIAVEAEQVLLKALELAPHNSFIAYTLGQVFCNHPLLEDDQPNFLSQAIRWFHAAVSWDPENVIAQLYLAHCFHDLALLDDHPQHWEQAIIEYRKVDQARLARDWPEWRAVKCREQLAACLAGAGKEPEAIQSISNFLDELEAFEPDEFGQHDAIVNLDELVWIVTHKLPHSELIRRARIQVKRFGFEDRYTIEG
ncbi:MAG TPA: hypothetical protein PKE58_23380 [Acidobacteriota bacterium]|nr:hypothetical protein [Acidobacteriota bacterium]